MVRTDSLSVEQTTQKRLGTVLFYGIVVILAYFVFLVFQPFLARIGLGNRHRGGFLSWIFAAPGAISGLRLRL